MRPFNPVKAPISRVVSGVALGLVAMTFVACGLGSGASSADIAALPNANRRASSAVASGKGPRQLLSLMHPNARSVAGEVALEQHWNGRKDEREAIAKSLSDAALRKPTLVIATLGAADQGPALSFETGQWRMQEPLSTALAETPQQALSQLLDALAGHDMHALLRNVGPRTRSALERNLVERERLIRAVKAAPLKPAGADRMVPISGKQQIELLRIDGHWVVEWMDTE